MSKANENLFCDCNSEWLVGSQHQLCISDTDFCNKCGMYEWKDAYYEDMLFDLRNMNLIW